MELGPEGGEKGGQLVYAGPPEGLLKQKGSPTGRALSQQQ
jgi:excinuclease ABC subunit A